MYEQESHVPKVWQSGIVGVSLVFSLHYVCQLGYGEVHWGRGTQTLKKYVYTMNYWWITDKWTNSCNKQIALQCIILNDNNQNEKVTLCLYKILLKRQYFMYRRKDEWLSETQGMVMGLTRDIREVFWRTDMSISWLWQALTQIYQLMKIHKAI